MGEKGGGKALSERIVPTVSEQQGRRSGRRGDNALDSEKGLAEGSGRVSGWSESVDRLLDSSPRFNDAVRAAYSRFCLPSPELGIQPAHLLFALQYFLQKILDDLDEKAGKVCLRPVTQEDIDIVLRNDKTIVQRQGQLIEFGAFDRCARHVLKRVALDQGKRLGLFMLGGVVVVHMTKSVVKKIPFVGGLLSALMPTALTGPVVGIAGAIYL